jgi:hypothetical protein
MKIYESNLSLSGEYADNIMKLSQRKLIYLAMILIILIFGYITISLLSKNISPTQSALTREDFRIVETKWTITSEYCKGEDKCRSNIPKIIVYIKPRSDNLWLLCDLHIDNESHQLEEISPSYSSGYQWIDVPFKFFSYLKVCEDHDIKICCRLIKPKDIDKFEWASNEFCDSTTLKRIC